MQKEYSQVDLANFASFNNPIDPHQGNGEDDQQYEVLRLDQDIEILPKLGLVLFWQPCYVVLKGCQCQHQ